eukprot:snap_masked-scaffold_39-processed-gene-2.32-mRNA-1 protein AED:1.00 eAED:1.00 QI:0/0/0/0/1/1/2/0/71
MKISGFQNQRQKGNRSYGKVPNLIPKLASKVTVLSSKSAAKGSETQQRHLDLETLPQNKLKIIVSLSSNCK